MNRPSPIVWLIFLLGVACGALMLGQLDRLAAPALAADTGVAAPQPDLARLQTRIAMVAADYHASNLWFAGRAENWTLADFYWKEVQSHMQLSAQSNPSGASDAKLKQILQAIEASPTMRVDEAIKKQDLRTFNAAYRTMLAGCYECHKAAGKPYLRPRIPVPPSSSLINVDPKATWPQ